LEPDGNDGEFRWPCCQACSTVVYDADEIEPRWKWENNLVRLHRRCLPHDANCNRVRILIKSFRVLMQAPHHAVTAALSSVLPGASVRLFWKNVSQHWRFMANTLVIGLSSALGSLVFHSPEGDITFRMKEFVLFCGSHCSPHWSRQICGKADGFGMDSKQGSLFRNRLFSLPSPQE